MTGKREADRCACQCGRPGCASIRRTHGQAATYEWGCRCEACCEAKGRKGRRQVARKREATIDGPRRGYIWTGAEMELAMRDDMSVMDIAKALGRTYNAVHVMRARCRREPKYAAAAGLAQEPQP